MTKERKQLVWLAVLGLVLIVVIVKVALPGTTAEPRSRPSNRTARANAARGAKPVEVPVSGLRLERLNAQRDDLPATDRNPFRFRPKPAPAPPPVVQAPRPQAVPQPQVPTGPPPLPPIPLKFIGFAGDGNAGGLVGFFSDGRGHTLLGKEGETLDGQFRVLRISENSADLVYLDGRGRQTIRLSGQ